MIEYSPRQKFFIVTSLIVASGGLVFCAIYGVIRMLERFGWL